MFGEGHHDSVIQRGIDEALACQDMLERTPIKPSWISQMVTGLSRRPGRFANRKTDLEHQATASAPHAHR